MIELHEGSGKSAAPIFISYAKSDNESSDPAKRWLDRLVEHLKPLALQGLITTWSDQQIEIGEEWHVQIQSALTSARIAVLLVSPAFLASEYIRNNELPILLRRAREEGVLILPIILRPCLYTTIRFNFPDPETGPEQFSLADLQAANSPNHSLSELDETNQDRALVSVCRRIQQVLQSGQTEVDALAYVAAVGRESSRPGESRSSLLNRQRLIQRVRNDWIDGILRQSYRTGHLALGLRPKSEATERLWDVVVRQTGEASQMLPSTARISSVFDDFEEQLLILGAPGAGKTVTLLELARDLLDRAQQNSLYPVPVVLNLSTWADFNGTFEEWLIDELSKRYGVPKRIGKDWINNDEVIPLLDGLDEVSPISREDCVEAINGYHLEHCALAVCSRLGDYESLSTRLNMRGAVAIQPLTREQTRTYLNEAGSRLSGLLAALEEDETLWELLDTPLMLNVASLADAEQTTTNPATGTLRERRDQLFANYVDAVFQRAGRAKASRGSTGYTKVKTLSSLKWLATAMKLNGQSVLYVGWMQPTWLKSKLERVSYRLTSTLFGALVFAVTFAMWFLILAWFTLKNGHSQFGDGWGSQIQIALFIGKFFGVAGGLIICLRRPIAAALVGILFVPVLEKIGMHKSFSDFRTSLLGMMVFAFAFWLATKAIGASGSITPVERIRWSWDKAKTKLRAGLLTGSAAGLILGLLLATVYALGPNNGYKGTYSHIKYFNDVVWVGFFLFAAIVPSVLGAALATVIAGSFGGFFMGAIETRMRPNEEIWRPAKTIAIGVLAGLALTCLAAVMRLPNLWLLTWIGVACGLILLLRLGGLPFLEHWSLRLILAVRGHTPWNYVRFLNHASDLILLRRAGGGYIFMHRLLLDHFAAIDERSARAVERARESHPIPE